AFRLWYGSLHGNGLTYWDDRRRAYRRYLPFYLNRRAWDLWFTGDDHGWLSTCQAGRSIQSVGCCFFLLHDRRNYWRNCPVFIHSDCETINLSFWFTRIVYASPSRIKYSWDSSWQQPLTRDCSWFVRSTTRQYW